MYAAAEADSAAAGGSTGATGEADDDVVDAEIVDEPTEGSDDTGTGDSRQRRRRGRAEVTEPQQPPVEPVETPEEDSTGSAPGWAPGSFPESAAEMANETEVEEEPVMAQPSVEEDDLAELQLRLAERTADLQRVQAEYLNYKRRVDRDRELVKQNATYAALAPITEVIDTIDRAREHGELEGGFKAVADQLERILAGVGLVKFGAVGRPVRPDVPRGAEPHRRGPGRHGDHLQGDRQGRLPDRRPGGPRRPGPGGRPAHGPDRARPPSRAGEPSRRPSREHAADETNE